MDKLIKQFSKYYRSIITKNEMTDIEEGLSKDQILEMLNDSFENIYRSAKKIIKLLDYLPCTYAIAKLWNKNDHKARVKDGSISYEYFKIEKNQISYKINKCMYKEIFEYYGLGEYCKVFCNTDTMAYECLTRHVKFIRHSDLADGDCCFDEVMKK